MPPSINPNDGEPALAPVMPAEWRPHQRTIMAWAGSDSHSYWPPGDIDDINADVARVVEVLVRYEPVTIYVARSQIAAAREALQSVEEGVEVRAVEDDELKPWTRDFVPTFAVTENGVVRGICFQFNGWGHKDPTTVNRQLAARVLEDLHISACDTWLVAEGGAIETDGEGTLLATESALVNSNRNPGKDRAAIADELRRVLGVTTIIWLAGVAENDITDCHVDALARFVKPGLVVLSRPSPVRGLGYAAAYAEARRVLLSSQDAKKRNIKVVEIYEPDARRIKGAHRDMIPSYVNFFHTDGAVLVPQFGSPDTDAKAMWTFRDLFSDKEIVPVRLHGLPNAGGGIHCITQQVPTQRKVSLSSSATKSHSKLHPRS